jgi:hypothetical protein
MDDLKKVYQAIKKSIPSGAGPVNDYDIQKASALDDTQVRVAISMLDRAELITRRLDVPTSVSINVGKRGGAGDGFEDFAESARLRAGQNFQVDIRDLAYRTNVPLREVESALLKWRDEGCLTYRTSGRTMYIELCGSRKGARADMQAMLDTHRAEAIRKVKILADYAKSSRCRHDIISRYFGEAPITGCRSCDNCIKGGAPAKLSDEHLTILKGVECLPIRFSASALVKAFMGASGCPMKPHEWPHLGVFSGRTRDSVKQMIDDLIDWGYLVHDGTILRPLLVLTPAGRKLAVRPIRNAERPMRNADCGLRNGERDG